MNVCGHSPLTWMSSNPRCVITTDRNKRKPVLAILVVASQPVVLALFRVCPVEDTRFLSNGAFTCDCIENNMRGHSFSVGAEVIVVSKYLTSSRSSAVTHRDSCFDIKMHRKRQFGLLLLSWETNTEITCLKSVQFLASVVPVMGTLQLWADRAYLKVQAVCFFLSFILFSYPLVSLTFKLSPS